MDRKFHFLVNGPLEDIKLMFQGAHVSYARYFNRTRDHAGPVFQGRFASIPVETDEQLLETVRYIHLAPREDGMTNAALYPWSSYRECIGEPWLCDASFVVEMFGGVEELQRFHAVGDETVLARNDGYRPKLDDAQAMAVGEALFGVGFTEELGRRAKPQRDEAIMKLFNAGVSVRQIERLTGIGRGAVQRACKGPVPSS